MIEQLCASRAARSECRRAWLRDGNTLPALDRLKGERRPAFLKHMLSSLLNPMAFPVCMKL
eukprot:770854-Pleurochrysis_carterae.AAC.1